MQNITQLQPVNCKININPFLLGIARLFDFAQVLDTPGKKHPTEIDRIALSNDWIELGKDMQTAIDVVALEMNNGKTGQ